MRKTGIPSDKYGHVEVALQDQFTDIINLYAINIKGTTTLASAADADDTEIEVASATGAVIGEAFNISEDGKTEQCIVSGIDGTTITVSCPLNRDFTTAAVVEFGAWNANLDGSSDAKTFSIKPPAGIKWDITGINFNITDATAMDDALFGGATALTNGILVRRADGTNTKMLEVTNNGGFGEQHCTMMYSDKAPSGSNGLLISLDITNKFGVTVRLDGDYDDELQLLVRDNLTVLTKFVMTARGHEVE